MSTAADVHTLFSRHLNCLRVLSEKRTHKSCILLGKRKRTSTQDEREKDQIKYKPSVQRLVDHENTKIPLRAIL